MCQVLVGTPLWSLNPVKEPFKGLLYRVLVGTSSRYVGVVFGYFLGFFMTLRCTGRWRTPLCFIFCKFRPCRAPGFGAMAKKLFQGLLYRALVGTSGWFFGVWGSRTTPERCTRRWGMSWRWSWRSWELSWRSWLYCKSSFHCFGGLNQPYRPENPPHSTVFHAESESEV